MLSGQTAMSDSTPGPSPFEFKEAVDGGSFTKIIDALFTTHDNALRFACSSAEEAAYIASLLSADNRYHYDIQQKPIPHQDTGAYSHTELVACRLHISNNQEWWSADTPGRITHDMRRFDLPSVDEKSTSGGTNTTGPNPVSFPTQTVLLTSEMVYAPGADDTVLDWVTVNTRNMDAPTKSDVAEAAINKSTRLGNFAPDEVVDDTIQVFFHDGEPLKMSPREICPELAYIWS
jgi:hypothetical protein